MTIREELEELEYVVLCPGAAKSRETLGRDHEEEPCDMRFHHLDAPCKDCPAQKLTGAGYEYLEQEMQSWGCLTYTRACNLTWKHDGHPVMLVIQKPS